jgi:hypothetical protein
LTQASYLGGPSAGPLEVEGGRMVQLSATVTPQELPAIVVTDATVAQTTAIGPSISDRLLQGTLNLIPGFYFAGLAQQQLRAGNYG